MTAITIEDLDNAKEDVDLIAEVANSLSETAIDRMGNEKLTVTGAMNRLVSINFRGPWATATAYAVKDAFSDGGVVYVTVVAHTSTSISADLAAGKIGLYQGVATSITDDFYDGADYTAGTTDVLTLSRAPGSKENITVFFGGTYQDPSQFDLLGTTLTFTDPIPAGVGSVFVQIGRLQSSVTPSARSVGDDELSWGQTLARAVDSIADLRNLPPSTYRRAHVNGYYVPGDLGGGDFYYDSSFDPLFDNGGTIIAAFGGTGCWRRVLIGSTCVSVRQFGAKGDWNGTTGTNDSAAFQEAINWCQNNKLPLYVPGLAADGLVTPNFGYCVKGLVISKPITIFGEGTSHNTPALVLWDGSDSQLFTVQVPGVTLRGLMMYGSATVLTTNQRLVYIQNTNEVQLEDCLLHGGYDNLFIDGTSFYLSFLNCKFGDAINSWMKIFSAAPGGVDFFMDNCRGITGGGLNDAGLSFTGIGSCLVTNCQFSPNTGDRPTLKVYSQASAAGVFQFTNVVFETAGMTQPGVWLMGDVANPCKYWQFVNCYSLGNPALRVDYGFNIFFNDGYLTGGGTACHIENQGNQITLDNVNFQVNGATVLTLGNSAANLSIHVREPMYTGLGVFAAYDNVPLSSWNWLSIEGGNIGLANPPIKLTDPVNTPGAREAKGYNFGVVKRLHLTANLVAGAATVAHGINSASARITNLSVFARVMANQATPIDRFATVDNTNVVISGSGVGNVLARIIIEYVDSDPAW